jgi:hypothetical protein
VGRAARWGWKGLVGGEEACQGVVVGAEGAMAAAHCEPSSPEQNNRSSGGPGTWGAEQKGREGKWDGHGLEKLVDRRIEAERECSVRATAAARWRR